MFSGGVDPEEAAAKLGLPVEIVAQAEGFADCLVYPDNWPAVMIFRDMGTQWRVGPGGIVGLDYGVLPVVTKIRGIKQREMGEMLDSIQIMEAEAIELVRSRG